MKGRLRLFSLSNNLDSLLAALIGFLLIQIYSKHSGIGVSPDSVAYISAARHLVHGNGFLSFDNLPTVDFPFGYPFFLTILSFFSGLDPLQFGPWLNGLLFGLLIYCSGVMMNGFSNPSGWYKRILLLCIVMSPALQEVYSMLWSETVFLLLIFLFIIAISNYLKQKTMKWLLISVCICALTCICRYAGVFLVFTGLAVVFFNKGNPWPKKMKHCLIFGIFSVSFLLVNIIRNLSETGFTTGMRPKSGNGILKILEYFGAVFCKWLLFNSRPTLAVLLALFVLFIFTLTIGYTWRRFKNLHSFEFLVGLTGLIYSAFMLLSNSIIRYEQFTGRLLSPLYIPLLWSLSWWIPSYISSRSLRMKWIIGITVLIGASWFLNIQLRSDYEYYDGVKDAGIPGYREDPFIKSEFVQYINKNKPDLNSGYRIYSNAADAFYFITDQPALQLPINEFPSKLQEYYLMDHNYLIWFDSLYNSDMPDLHTILKNKNMVLLNQLSDGAVYITK